MLDLLKHKIFRVFLSYYFFSVIGSAMFFMFILLSVHLLYENPIYTGIAGFLMAAPRIASITVGPIVDRRNKVIIMRLTTLLEFFVLALLAFTPLLENFGVLFMFGIILVYSTAALFENPASTAFLPQIIPEDKILEANSLLEILAMVGGITIGSVLFISLGGEANFSFIFGLSAVFLGIAFMSSLILKNPATNDNREKATTPKYLVDLKEGVKFISHNVLLYIAIAAVAMNLAGQISFVNRPMFLTYHVGPQGYVLFSLMGLVGGIIGSTLAGKLGNKFKLGQLIFVLFMFAGLVRILFALVVPLHYLGGLITVVFYLALMVVVNVIFTSLNQKIPPNDMVGRVNAISRTCVAIAVMIGALLGGYLGSVVPVIGYIFIFQGINYVVIGLLIMLVPSIRRLPMMNEIKKLEG